ncbi:hypothetical protein SAMN02745194_03331 [Roseomonas rosea]|uniref:Uncharacterized protein n=1 Tax=Muricoccus roseus TaxID=198092 RepID=A0A1M6M2T3_9PROT|nr:hypothetical protein [Roseomonas rosea]SHJ77716.1 hypothetical protein SAMN02745194_03331 [Roseomonas rosea]
MPDRLSSLAAAIGAQNIPVTCPARHSGDNDNAGPAQGDVEASGPPEPTWEGPGAILALGVQNGRHGLGAVRATVGEASGDAAADMATLLRLLTHYGMWMGFEGDAEPIRRGKLRQLPVEVGARGRVEYRLDLRRIMRGSQRLIADGTILLNGRPSAMLDGLSVAFRPSAGGAGRRPRPG